MARDDGKLTTSDISDAMRRREADVHEAERRERLDRDRVHPDPVDRERLESDRPLREQPVPTTEAAADVPGPLFADEELNGYRTRWSAIQTGFVDEPRRAVEEADTLVAELMKRLTDSFADERRQLESRWEHSDRVSTEDLRLAMRRYRSFFERLLSV